MVRNLKKHKNKENSKRTEAQKGYLLKDNSISQSQNGSDLFKKFKRKSV